MAFAIDALGVVGGSVFGRGARLQLLAWIGDQERPFYQKQAADGSGVAQAYVRKELDNFCDVGLISELKGDPADVRNYFVKVPDHRLWPGLILIIESVRAWAAEEDADPPVARTYRAAYWPAPSELDNVRRLADHRPGRPPHH